MLFMNLQFVGVRAMYFLEVFLCQCQDGCDHGTCFMVFYSVDILI